MPYNISNFVSNSWRYLLVSIGFELQGIEQSQNFVLSGVVQNFFWAMPQSEELI
jgi:hypothetical protein